MSAPVRRAAVMARVSTAEQEQDRKSGAKKTSLETQLAKGHAEVQRRDWTLAGEFVDVYTGTKDSRPELQKALAAARAGEIDAIVFTKYDRFARNLRDLLNIEHELSKLGVVIVATDQNIDTSTLAGRAMFQVLGTFAEFERGLIVERMATGQYQTAVRGRWPGGDTPFGYRLTGEKHSKNRKVEIDPVEGECVRVAVASVVDQGLSTWETAAQLNALGFRPRKAARWSHRSLLKALRGRALVGEVVWAKRPSPGWVKEGHHHSTGRWGPPVPIKIPAILDDERWEALQTALNGAPGAGAPQPMARVYPLSGRDNQRLLAPCGGVFRGVHRGDRDLRQYVCSGAHITPRSEKPKCGCKRIRAGEIEAVVKAEIRALLVNPERLLRMATDFLEIRGDQMSEERDQLGDLDTKIAQLEQGLRRAYADGYRAAEPSAHQAAIRDLEADLATRRKHRAQVELWKAGNLAESVARQRLWTLGELGHRLDTMTVAEWRQLIALLDVRVKVIEFCEPDEVWPHPWEIRIEGTIYEDLVERLSEPGDAPAWGGRRPTRTP